MQAKQPALSKPPSRCGSERYVALVPHDRRARRIRSVSGPILRRSTSLAQFSWRGCGRGSVRLGFDRMQGSSFGDSREDKPLSARRAHRFAAICRTRRPLGLEPRRQSVDYRRKSSPALRDGGKAPVAQRIEHQTSNLGVARSSRAGRTNKINNLAAKREVGHEWISRRVTSILLLLLERLAK